MEPNRSGAVLLTSVLATVALMTYALGRETDPSAQFDDTADVPVETAEAAPAVPVDPPLVRAHHSVEPGEPLDRALARLDLAPSERQATTAALGEFVDLRRILPGERVEVARTAKGSLREVTLRRDALESVRVQFTDGDSPIAETLRRQPEVHIRRIEGELEGSLYEAVLGAGGDANLTMRFADLLGWEVDFLTEPRAGDRFRIVVREEYLDGGRLGFGKILSAEYTGARASATALRYVDADGGLDWYDDAGHSVRRAFLKSPLSYRRISSHFNAHRKHPILKTVRPHWGVDYAAPLGTPVSALGQGVVQFAGRKGGYGNYIEVRHSSTYTTCYGHLSRFAKGIRSGARVEQGDVIGYVGSTGLSTGPHLDFRVKKNGGFVDPLKLDSPPGRALNGNAHVRFAGYRDRAWELANCLGVGESVPEGDAWARVGPLADAETMMAWGDPAPVEPLAASR